MILHNIRPQAKRGYTTWGCMWKQGECSDVQEYTCIGEKGNEVPMQSRVTAYWPDGSVKWTAHTADAALLGQKMKVIKKADMACACQVDDQKNGIVIEETEKHYNVCSGEMTYVIPKDGHCLVEKVTCGKQVRLRDVSLVLELEHPVVVLGNEGRVVQKYTGKAENITIEQEGRLQTIIKYEGTHLGTDGSTKLPFIVRMTIEKDCRDMKFLHTFLYDGDENKDFLKGIGISYKMPFAGEMYNRHVKCMADHGVFHESVVPLLSWRPRVPEGLYNRQVSGECLKLDGDNKRIVDKILEDTPYWSEYSICQDSASHFVIKKKLRGNHLCYIDSLHGTRTDGACACGSEAGSVIMSIRDFWQKYPSGYTIKGLDTDETECTMWFWSPQTEAFDYRHYADRGYNQVCYEGYDYKGADPDGIACSNEGALTICDEMIPSDDMITDFCNSQNYPAVYVGTPEFYHEMRAFGYWSLPSENTPMEKWLETQLEQLVDFYLKEVEQRGWYGMYNYGDFMHSYDSERHQWKYDIGGYAWDNTELVPTLWLWLYFMRTGREDVFTLAEKLCRHASEVDVYHFGRYKGLGSRHNVRHWGCPCKEARIAMAGHHRFLYYMTGNRRFEDIFDELKDNELSFLNRDPLGDFYDKKDMVYPSHARSGPDWSSLCSNWMTQWERTKDTTYRDKINVGLTDIKNAPLKLSSGPDFEFDPKTVHLRYIGERTTGGCHLQICMGAPQIWMELADLLEDEEFKEMIAQYGRFYYLTHEQQLEESHGLIGNRESSLPFMSAAMGAYGAKYLNNEWLAKRTWQILLQTILKEGNHDGFKAIYLKDCGNQENLMEIPWITTNFAAQWGLNVIMVLEFIKDALPETIEKAEELVQDMPEVFFRKA